MATPRIDRLDKNYIINGRMDIWQRGSTFTISKTGSDGQTVVYTADRTAATVIRNGFDLSLSSSRQVDVPSGTDFTYSNRVTSNGSYTFGSSSAALIPHYQLIEGRTVSDWNPLEDVYISFYVKSNVSIAGLGICLRKMLASGGVDSSYSWLEPLTANTWKRVYKKITLPATAIRKDSAEGFAIIIGGISGSAASSRTSTPDAWVSGDKWALSAATNWAATSGTWIQMTGLKISQSPHDLFSSAGRTFAEELVLCQRYFEKSYDLDAVPGTVNEAGSQRCVMASATTTTASVRFAVMKRSTPVFTVYSTVTGAVNVLRNATGGGDAAALLYQTANGLTGVPWIDTAITVTANSEMRFHWTAESEL